MNERIQKLTELTLEGKMHPTATDTDISREYYFLPKHECQARRIHDYIMAQKTVLTEYQTMAGAVNVSNGKTPGDYMKVTGLKNLHEILLTDFYCKPVENISTFEWQHATADYNKVIRIGIKGLLEEIEKSKKAHKDDNEKLDFLESLKIVADTLIEFAHKCSGEAYELAQTVQNPEYRANLTRLSETLKKIPENPAESFYEAVLSIYILFNYDPDSLGTLDRTLYDFYKRDVESGAMTRDEAKIILQELFLRIQANTPFDSANFTRGGESHFCVGGYDENGEDIFNDFSMLILEALTELPAFIPQVSLRWTKKLPFDTFKRVFDMSVQDSNNRIAFISDEVKIKAAMENLKLPYEIACKYTSVGCNEVAYPGGFVAGTTNTNILRSVENTLYKRTEDIVKAKTWEEFFEIYKSEMYKDLDLMLYYDDEFVKIRARDTSYVTSLMFTDCIKNAETFTRGAIENAGTGVGLIGITNVFDSLAVIKQLVYDEKLITMSELVEALKSNWEGYEDLHTIILKKGKFFGNDDDTSNYVAKLFTDTLYEYSQDKTSYLGYRLIYGNLQGYNEHHKWFGERTRATPDGRYDGEMMKFGLSQSGGYDREGLTALLNSVAKCDKHGIMSGGSSVTNISLDEQLVTNPDNFHKTAKLLETYFQNGGSQLQLNYVSQEDLKKAKITPEQYKNLRVRVSGFSDFFVNLTEGIQDDIIERTVKTK